VSKPSVTYEPYKDPLTRNAKGYGYMGALGRTADGTYLECHVCGGLYKNLGIHAAKKHGLKEDDYRSKFRLSAGTTLAAPQLVERYVRAAANVPSSVMMQRLENLRRGRQTTTHRTWSKSLEQKNKEGVCPDQLIDKIQVLAAVLGHTPSLNEFRLHYKGCVRVVYSTFGSWATAVRIAGLDQAMTGRRPQYTREILIDMLARFTEQHHRRPYSSDLGRYLPSQWTFTKFFGSFSKALQAANSTEADML
jgi:hypothetical protein